MIAAFLCGFLGVVLMLGLSVLTGKALVRSGRIGTRPVERDGGAS